eukprot:jgi/Psemu1/309659/fgenesh1_kg.539_\
MQEGGLKIENWSKRNSDSNWNSEGNEIAFDRNRECAEHASSSNRSHTHNTPSTQTLNKTKQK